jgi:DNA (cytosine-5)-methyltransferase 1
LPTPRANEPGSTSVGYGDSLNDFANRVVNGYARKDIELLRSPTASQGEGGALGEAEARKRGNTVGIRDQAMDIAKAQGLKVSRQADNPSERQVSVPTPTASDAVFGGLVRKVTEISPNRGVSLPLWADRISNSFYLPTPTTRDYKDGSQPHEREGKVQTDTVARAVFNSGEVLLGTPRANAAESSAKEVEAGAPKSRIEDQVKLLPTVRGQNGESRNNNIWERDPKQPQNLENALYHAITNWGKFEPAIRRWEAIIDRPAPEPTKPDGKEGNHRLSSKFTEWMMGLPDGWITGHGLKRNDELKLAGNGVVPQQAELALSLLGIKEILEKN